MHISRQKFAQNLLSKLKKNKMFFKTQNFVFLLGHN